MFVCVCSFKVQAVEKALGRENNIKLKDIANELGVGNTSSNR